MPSAASAASATPATPANAPAKARRKAPAKGAAAPKRLSTKTSASANPKAKASPKPQPATQRAGKPAVPSKPVRVKLVRDSFTMPKPDFELIEALKQRTLRLGREVKKSELLRAGLHTLSGLADAALVAAVQAVPRLKTGRPHKRGK